MARYSGDSYQASAAALVANPPSYYPVREPRHAGGWARADEFRCAEASVKVRASPAREAAPPIRSVSSRRTGGGRKGATDDRCE